MLLHLKCVRGNVSIIFPALRTDRCNSDHKLQEESTLRSVYKCRSSKLVKQVDNKLI